MSVVGRMAFAAAVPIFLGWAFLEPAETSARSVSPTSVAAIIMAPDDSPTVWPVPSGSDDHTPETAQSETDLYGNEVNDAVAEYSLDSSGSLYEMHAPQVEVPKLGSPKS